MDDLLSQVSQQFEEDIKHEEPKKEEIKNEEIIKERFKVSERYIEQRREMVELSKIESDNNDDAILKSKTRPKEREKKEEKSTKKEEKRGYGYGSGGYGYGYGSTSSQKKDDSTKNQEKATEYADNVFDSLREKIEDEFNADIPEDWDIFDIHSKASENHKIAKEAKIKGKLPMSVRFKLAALKTCIYVGHSTLETLYVLKNE